MDDPWTSLIIQLTLVLFVLHFSSTFKQSGTCYFPERWEGTWFQSGVRQSIVIEGPILSNKGRCLSSEGDKFLLVDDKTACYKCVVIHEKHVNVLQYKETYCQSREALPTLCGFITGDALLYSMFRENALAIPCPFHGPFTFTYNRGYGECKSPVSSIDACTEESKLLLSYQACPDVLGSESAIEVLECLAVWKEGSSRYLVGKLHHNHATSNEDRFRCFVYEKFGGADLTDDADYKIAQSGDATCNGLFSATEGSRTMTLRKAQPTNKCRFPYWLAVHGHWHTLDYSATYSFHHRNSTLRITNSTGMEMRVVCVVQQKHPDDGVAVLVTHFTMGCQNGYIGMIFYQRDDHVVEVQMGAQTKRREDALGIHYFDKNTLSFVTLVTTSPASRSCPYTGKFEVDNLIQSRPHPYSNKHSYLPDNLYFDSKFFVHKSTRSAYFGHDYGFARRVKRVDQSIDCDSNGYTNLIIGCSSYDTMEFRTVCAASDWITSYTCHGRWEENGTSYLIATPLSRASFGARRYCFIYKESQNTVMFSTSADSCDRQVKPGVTGELIFNISSIGKCVETNSATLPHTFGAWSLFSVFSCLKVVIQR